MVNIDEIKIQEILETSQVRDTNLAGDIFKKALDFENVTNEEIATLIGLKDSDQINELYETALSVKRKVFGDSLNIFVPLYISNYCCNDCEYCAFRSGNRDIVRVNLSQDEIGKETEVLLNQGHKNILLVTGEAYPASEGISYIIKAVDTISSTKSNGSMLRRVDLNFAPVTVDEFRQLKDANIGTYHLYQETYHKKTYSEVHPRGKKADYDYRISTMDRAIDSGLTDIGMGVLLGLYDWRFELLALIQHIRHIEQKYGILPHTINVPRVGPALGARMASDPPFKVSNADFKKFIAIIRLVMPFADIVMSTRETPLLRRDTYALGVSRISAGSTTSPGAYSSSSLFAGVSSQFQLGDLRSLEEVVLDAAVLGYIPSFYNSTGCFSRTVDTVQKAKNGEHKDICQQNGLATFLEYILDYASDDTRLVCEKQVEKFLDSMDSELKNKTQNLLDKIRSGERNINFD